MTESEDGALLSRIRAAVAGETGIPVDLQPAFALADSIPDIGVFQRACHALEDNRRSSHPGSTAGAPQWLIDAAEFLHAVDMCNCPVVRPSAGPIGHWAHVQTLFVYAIHKTYTDDMMMMGGSEGGGDEAEPDPDYAARQRLDYIATMRARSEAVAAQPVGELARWAAGVA